VLEMERPDYARRRRSCQAIVEFPGSTAKNVLRAATAILAKKVAPADLADLAGADDEALVQVVNPVESILTLAADSPNYRFTGRLIRQPDECLELHIDEVFVPDSGQREGVGTQALNRQIQAARRFAFRRIKLLAVRGGSYVGYKVWPKFGFDAPLRLTAKQRASLPESLQPATKLSDLYTDPVGIGWWEKNGFSLAVEFDLLPGSLSLFMWKAYLKRWRK
jgi:GNAT superfamily N-acetyltransferase